MQVDVLIIGQGISGSFLSWYLHKAGKSFHVIDNAYKNAPSRLAAGLINPVTGRRLVTVWMADEIIPFAVNAYQQMEEELGITAISQKNIIEFFPNPFMRESFLKRIQESDEYVREYPRQDQFSSYFRYEFGCGEIKPAYTAHLETVLPAWRKKLEQEQTLSEEEFDNSQLQVSPGKIIYKNINASQIVFCDGAGGGASPYFKQLPFAPNKGEALVVEIKDLPKNHIYKKSMTLVPMVDEHIFWIGSNYHWSFDNSEPTDVFRASTGQVLKEWLKLPYKILDHRVGIRPATIERRPFVGFHPIHKNIGILNGMGTKGSSLAPYFAKQLTDHITNNKPIIPEADISRFNKILSRS